MEKQVAKRKTPMRMCVGCRKMCEKNTLARVVRSPSGDVSLDMVGKASGRGAYVCKKTECLEKAIKIKAIDRALGVTLDEETKDKLREAISNGT